jgi:hypothetical protein
VLASLVSARGAPTFQRQRTGVRIQGPVVVGRRVSAALVEPVKPWRDGVMGSFNGKFRDECLNRVVSFARPGEVIIETWRRHRD